MALVLLSKHAHSVYCSHRYSVDADHPAGSISEKKKLRFPNSMYYPDNDQCDYQQVLF